MLCNGYKVKIFNSINLQKPMHYNPFSYIHSEKDILKLVNTLIFNTKGDGKSGDDFWLKAGTLLYTALIGYIHYEAPEEEQNFATLIEFINAMEARRMMRPLRTMWIWPSRSWDSGSRITSPCGNIRNTSWRREMYALSDFLIMVFIMVSEGNT